MTSVTSNQLSRRTSWDTLVAGYSNSRRPTVTDRKFKSSLLALPSDVLVQVIQQLTIRDVFSLRLTCRGLAFIIVHLSRYISRNVSRNTAPGAKPALDVRSKAQSGPGSEFGWMRDCVYHYLAAILLEKTFDNRVNLMLARLPVSNAEGIEAREAIVDGLKVWKKLSDVSRAVFGLRPEIVEQQLAKFGTGIDQVGAKWLMRDPVHNFESAKLGHGELVLGFNMVLKRELLIYKIRLKCLERFSAQDLIHYNRMFALISSFVFTGWRASPGYVNWTSDRDGMSYEKDFFDWQQLTGRSFEWGNSWIHWWLLHEGPDAFWKQWYVTQERDFIKLQALDSWASRSKEEIQIERAAAWEINRNLKSRVVSKSDIGAPIELYENQFRGVLINDAGKQFWSLVRHRFVVNFSSSIL